MRRTAKWLAAALFALPAALFLCLSCVRLDAQGLYYDELHQATGAFTYLGSPPEYFARAVIGGIPLLNMPYSGAIKTAVYGVYLRFVNPQFSVVGWRLVGVLFVCGGLLVFTWLAAPTLAPIPLAVVLALLISDRTVLLGARHDWGPIALALALRLALIAVWLRGEAAERVSAKSSLRLGFLVGLMIFEKLSSSVMLIALAGMFLSPSRRTRQHLLAAAGGLALGALPLGLVNLPSLLAEGRLVSLRAAGTVPDRSWPAFLEYGWRYAQLGAGDYVSRFILGSPVSVALRRAEPCLLILTVMLAAGVSLLQRRERSARAALIALGCYVGIGVALYLLPRRTGVHHWVLGTPFQYVAVGLALGSGMRAVSAASAHVRTARRWLVTAVAALLVVRLAGLISLEHALWRGEAARGWDPSLTQLGRFAASRAGEAIFIAADWGVATQIYCLSNGRPGLVYEPYWSYRGPLDLLRLQQRSGAPVLYAVALNPPSRVMPATTERIFHDLATAPYWREVAIDMEASSLAAVTVRKFQYDPRSAGSSTSLAPADSIAEERDASAGAE